MSDSVTCAACGRVVGVYRNGRIRPHYSGAGLGLCSGAYVIGGSAGAHAVRLVDGSTGAGAEEIAAELLDRAGEAGRSAAA